MSLQTVEMNSAKVIFDKEKIDSISQKIKFVMESKWNAIEQIKTICKELGAVTT